MQFWEKQLQVWENRDIKLVTTEARSINLVSEPNYQKTKTFLENLLTIEIKKT